MSSKFQNRMYHYEVNPPEKVWDTIAAALDQLQADKKTAAALLQTGINPPAQAWTAINAALDQWDADIKTATTLSGTEIIPPSFVWENISLELEELEEDKIFRDGLINLEVTPPDIWAKLNTELNEAEPEQQLAGKLLALEVWPPEESWQKIEKRLPEKPAAKIIGISTWKKWAAAAVITGVLTVSAVLLLQQNKTGENNMAVVPEKPKPVYKDLQKDSGQIQIIDPSGQANAPVTAETAITSSQKKKQVQPVPQDEPLVIASFLPETSDQGHNASPAENKRRLHKALHNSNTENVTAALDNRYYHLLNADGELVRVSRKLDEMQCVIKSGLDIPLDENDEKNRQCNEQVKDWQDKLNNSSVISALDMAALISGK